MDDYQMPPTVITDSRVDKLERDLATIAAALLFIGPYHASDKRWDAAALKRIAERA